MASTQEEQEAVSAQGDAARIDAPAERMYALLSGHFAGGYDAAAARLAMDRKRRTWLERQDRLDPRAAKAMDARIAAGDRDARSRLDDLGRAVAVPLPEAGAMVVSGRVMKDGTGQPDLTVSALDRAGKALACGKTGGGGIFRFRLTEGGEAILMVAGAKGETLLVDDRVIEIERGGIAYRELDLSAARAGPCPDGPDLSARAVMPDLVGKPIEEARQKAKDAGIEIVDVKVKASEGPEHVVLSSDPQAGRLLADPPRCSVVISARQGQAADIKTVGAVMKAQHSIKVPDQIVDRLVAGIEEKKAGVAEDLRKLAAGTDRAFAAITGIAREDATLVRKSLDAVLKQLGHKKR
jgi:hypothetical protein